MSIEDTDEQEEEIDPEDPFSIHDNLTDVYNYLRLVLEDLEDVEQRRAFYREYMEQSELMHYSVVDQWELATGEEDESIPMESEPEPPPPIPVLRRSTNTPVGRTCECCTKPINDRPVGHTVCYQCYKQNSLYGSYN